MFSFPRIAWFAAALLPALSAQAQRGYVPQGRVTGTVRVWGSAQMQELMRLWEAGFHRYQPGVRFEERLKGTVSAMGGLYAGAAGLALMGREIWPEETLAYTQVTGAAPTGVEVAMGSFDVPTKADALMVFVARNNPLAQIRFGQLAALFGCGDREPPTWSQAGATGQFGTQPVHVYGYLPDNAAARFFQSRVLRGAPWNCRLNAFGNLQTKAGGRVDAGRQIVDALAADPLGIAIANIHYATPAVKALALSEGPGLPFVAPDQIDYAAGRYPLTRSVFIYFHCESSKAGCSPADKQLVVHAAALRGDGEPDVSAGRGVFEGIVEEVDDAARPWRH